MRELLIVIGAILITLVLTVIAHKAGVPPEIIESVLEGIAEGIAIGVENIQ